MKPLVENSSDPGQVKAAQREKGWRRKQELEDIRQVWSTPHGRRIMRRYLTETSIYATTFCGDPYRTAYREGARTMGLMIFGDAREACPDFLALMEKESGDENEEEKRNG